MHHSALALSRDGRVDLAADSTIVQARDRFSGAVDRFDYCFGNDVFGSEPPISRNINAF